MTRPAKWPVRLAMTQISRGIHPVWSEPLLCADWVAKGSRFLRADSDWVDAQFDLSLRWVHMSFCWFCRAVAQMMLKREFD